MKRREFIGFAGIAAAAWPLAARAQQSQRRVGVLLSGAADDPEMEVRLAAFREEQRIAAAEQSGGDFRNGSNATAQITGTGCECPLPSERDHSKGKPIASLSARNRQSASRVFTLQNRCEESWAWNLLLTACTSSRWGWRTPT
jgi:hypothetical protein